MSSRPLAKRGQEQLALVVVPEQDAPGNCRHVVNGARSGASLSRSIALMGDRRATFQAKILAARSHGMRSSALRVSGPPAAWS